MNNNKGFTLVELLATLVVLALVAGIGAYSITNLISSTKTEDCNNLERNIKSAVEEYVQECKYSYTSSIKDICPEGELLEEIYLSDLVKYGYLTSNSENKDGKVFNPKTNENISDMPVKIMELSSFSLSCE